MWSRCTACWDASYGFAIRISRGIGGYGWDLDWPDTAAWVGAPSGGDLWRFQIAYDVLLAAIALIGLVWAIRRWRAYQIDRWTETHPRSESARAVV